MLEQKASGINMTPNKGRSASSRFDSTVGNRHAVIASVNADLHVRTELPPHIRSLGLISADSDDVTYIAADEEQPAGDGGSGIWSLAVCGRCTWAVTLPVKC